MNFTLLFPELYDSPPRPIPEQSERPLCDRPRLSPLPEMGSQHRQGDGVPHLKENHAWRFGEKTYLIFLLDFSHILLTS